MPIGPQAAAQKKCARYRCRTLYPSSCFFALGDEGGVGVANLPATAGEQVLAADLHAHLKNRFACCKRRHAGRGGVLSHGSDLHAAVEGPVDLCGNAHHLPHPKRREREDSDEEEEDGQRGEGGSRLPLPDRAFKVDVVHGGGDTGGQRVPLR